jgi:hypothetical protein
VTIQMSARTPFRSHLLQQWANGRRPPVPVVPWLRSNNNHAAPPTTAGVDATSTPAIASNAAGAVAVGAAVVVARPYDEAPRPFDPFDLPSGPHHDRGRTPHRRRDDEALKTKATTTPARDGEKRGFIVPTGRAATPPSSLLPFPPLRSSPQGTSVGFGVRIGGMDLAHRRAASSSAVSSSTSVDRSERSASDHDPSSTFRSQHPGASHDDNDDEEFHDEYGGPGSVDNKQEVGNRRSTIGEEPFSSPPSSHLLSEAMQSLLMSRRTATRLEFTTTSNPNDDGATPINSPTSQSVSSPHRQQEELQRRADEEEALLEALHRAVVAGRMAPNHKRTEPFSFVRFVSSSHAARQLADIAYHVALRKTGGSEAAARKKRDRWSCVPAFLVTLVHENHRPPRLDFTDGVDAGGGGDVDAGRPYEPLGYVPPTTERQLEDVSSPPP